MIYIYTLCYIYSRICKNMYISIYIYILYTCTKQEKIRHAGYRLRRSAAVLFELGEWCEWMTRYWSILEIANPYTLHPISSNILHTICSNIFAHIYIYIYQMTICHGSMIYLVYPFILGRTIKTGLSESPLFPLFHGSFGELMIPNWLLALVLHLALGISAK